MGEEKNENGGRDEDFSGEAPGEEGAVTETGENENEEGEEVEEKEGQAEAKESFKETHALSRNGVAAFLRRLADQVAGGTVQAGDKTVAVPEILELEFEFEAKGEKAEIEVEIKWGG